MAHVNLRGPRLPPGKTTVFTLQEIAGVPYDQGFFSTCLSPNKAVDSHEPSASRMGLYLDSSGQIIATWHDLTLKGS